MDLDESDNIISVKTIHRKNAPSIVINVVLESKVGKAAAQALLDSGATGNLMSQEFAKRNKVRSQPTPHALDLINANETMSRINTYTNMTMTITDNLGNTHRETIQFYIADIGQQDIILGTPWLIMHNPDIDWTKDKVAMTRCSKNCITTGQVHINSIHSNFTPTRRKIAFKTLGITALPNELWTEKDINNGHEWPGLIEARSLFLRKTTEQQIRNKQIFNRQTLIGNTPKASNTAQRLAQEMLKDKPKKTTKELVPAKYHDMIDIFEESKADRFPSSKPWDHAIEMKEGYIPKDCKIYPLSPAERQAEEEWINEQLKKGYIRPSKSPQASPFFFVGKKDGKLRPTQDYRYLNSQTIRNNYPLPLISDLIDKLQGAKLFTKMDVRWGYNNIRIKDGDQWKAAFKTHRGLFEPMVMFFGLCNSPATFQAMMNDIFKELIDQGVVVVYLDDILIFTKTQDEHEEVTRKVLEILRNNDLYLKPEKCEFERKKIEYLGMIISESHVEMDPIKVQGVTDWPRPKKVKEVQAFIGFCNFYRRFIEQFSHLARPLTQLTRKDTEWNWTPEAENAFVELKKRFTSAPILVMVDPEKLLRIESDASDYAWGAILSQLEEDCKWHPVAYISKTLSEAERNYDVHDKELKAIIGALETWRHYLEGAKYPIEIWTDHRNLEYFKKSQKLSRRQARWSQFLQRFDYILIHKPGITNKADGLSRRIDHKEGVENDNIDQIILTNDKFFTPVDYLQEGPFKTNSTGRGNTTEDPVVTKSIRLKTAQVLELQGDTKLKERIINATDFDDEVAASLETIRSSGPRSMKKGLQEWNYEDGLILYRGKIYVPKDNMLRREVVKSCHDPEARGHPGRWKTFQNVQANYWWPGMSIFVKNYVSGCATCQESKHDTHPTHMPIQPTEIPTRPFEFLTMDFIVELPKAEGYNAVLMIVDQLTKTAIAEPCTTKIDANQTAEILIKRVFCRYGMPKKIISDRGPQFAAKVMQAVMKSMGIHSALSTAYHPQTDGSTERWNQEAEQYLRAYCNRNQTNWVKLLPFAEMSHNTREHSATKKTPFELLFGYKPQWPDKIIPDHKIPAAEKRIKEVQKGREEAQAAIKISQEAMKKQQDRYGLEPPQWKVGTMVYLDHKNIKVQYPSAKLAPRRSGPFPITELIGKSSYRLELPTKWKIHNVFHGSLLKPYIETKEHGPNYPKPLPDIVEGEEEWEVDEIINVRGPPKNEKWEYLVSWVGYPDSEISWQPLENLENTMRKIRAWHRRNPEREKPPSVKLRLAHLSNELEAVKRSIITEKNCRRSIRRQGQPPVASTSPFGASEQPQATPVQPPVASITPQRSRT